MDTFVAVEIFTQIITYFMIAAGVPTCLSMLRSKDTYGVPYPFFLAGLVNSVMSIAYGFLVDNSTFIQINTIATLFNIFYVLSYIYASKSKSQPATQLMAGGGVVFCIYVYISRFVASAHMPNTLGSILLVITTVLLLTPMLQVQVLRSYVPLDFDKIFIITRKWFIDRILAIKAAVCGKEVVADKTAAGVSIFMLVCSTLCSSAWMVYGYLLKDFFIYKMVHKTNRADPDQRGPPTQT